jgi:RNA polymerase sigma-70 factor (ECF subfamily)
MSAGLASSTRTGRFANESRPSTEEPPAALPVQDKRERFDQILSMHLDAAYDLARWLTRDEPNAQDVVQEACLRAFKFLDGFRGGNARSWLLAIVRNTYYSWLEKHRSQALNVTLDEEYLDGDESALHNGHHEDSNDIDRVLREADCRRIINEGLEKIPAEFREAIVLRELEDMSYKEIAVVMNVPLGTVMSRLARGRKLLSQYVRQANQES